MCTESLLRPAVLVLSLGLLAPLAASAQPRQPQIEKKPDEKTEVPKYKAPTPEEKIVTTQHRITLGGTALAYTANTGTLLLKEEDGRPRASVFFVAYTKDGVQDVGKRPVTFTFNGGPGSSSVWLHLGAFGPRRVVMDDEGMAPAPPYHLTDNPESLLDVTDLVFIDPVSTGFSRAVPGEDPKQFHGVQEDLESVGEFIRLWTSRFGRWSSPKFLAGESYGTTRAAGLSYYLQDRHGMYFNGIVLISSILNFQTTEIDAGNDLPYVLFLPTYTATAWYHKKLPEDLQRGGLQQAVEEAKRFAQGEYAAALMQGSALTPEARRGLAAKLSRYTGLSPDFLLRANLRPSDSSFVKELLRDQRLTVGRLDSRFRGIDRDAVGEENERDPSYSAIQGPFTAMLNSYVSGELGFHSDLAYEILTGRVRPWNYGGAQNRYVDVADGLRQAMSQNPALKVFVANGYYDLATPFFATRYTFDHLFFDPGFAERVTMSYFEAGHMMYIRKTDREKLKADVAAFIKGASGG